MSIPANTDVMTKGWLKLLDTRESLASNVKMTEICPNVTPLPDWGGGRLNIVGVG